MKTLDKYTEAVRYVASLINFPSEIADLHKTGEVKVISMIFDESVDVVVSDVKHALDPKRYP